MTKPAGAVTAERDARIHKLLAQGLPYRDIKREVGCSIGTVANVAKRAKPTKVDAPPTGDGTPSLHDMVTAAIAKVTANAKPGTDLAMDDSITVEVIDTADSLDRRLRGCARDVDQSWSQLAEAVTAVTESEVHQELGFKTVVAYLADVVDTEMPTLKRNVELRQRMVALLDEQARMSQHAIGEVIGVDQRTVGRDLEQLRHDTSVDELATVTALHGKRTGLDGKRRPAHPKHKPTAFAPPAPRRKPARPVITDPVGAVINDLLRIANTLERVSEDDEFGEYKSQIATDDFECLIICRDALSRFIQRLGAR